MEFKSALNNVRVSPRKMRLIANLVKGMNAQKAQAQLGSFIKKDAILILKLLNSALANVKHNFSDEIKPENLFISKIVVEGGPMLKRWLPRAMGRATPLMKRTCSVKLVLAEIKPGTQKIKVKKSQPEILKPEEASVQPAEIKEEKAEIEKEEGLKDMAPSRPYDASGQS